MLVVGAGRSLSPEMMAVRFPVEWAGSAELRNPALGGPRVYLHLSKSRHASNDDWNKMALDSNTGVSHLDRHKS